MMPRVPGIARGRNGRSKLGPPMANSCVLSLPMTMAPAARSLPTTDCVLSAMLPRRIFEWPWSAGRRRR